MMLARVGLELSALGNSPVMPYSHFYTPIPLLFSQLRGKPTTLTTSHLSQ